MQISKIDKLKEIWSCIPEINCKKECSTLCKINHVFSLKVDNLLMKKDLQNQFVPLPNIYETLENGIDHKFHKSSSCCNCPYLENGLCSVYDVRPTICRLYGAMGECPYGCQPKHGSKFLTKDELLQIISDLKSIDPNDTTIAFFEEDVISYFDEDNNS